jgi:hypothetical protein
MHVVVVKWVCFVFAVQNTGVWWCSSTRVYSLSCSLRMSFYKSPLSLSLSLSPPLSNVYDFPLLNAVLCVRDRSFAHVLSDVFAPLSRCHAVCHAVTCVCTR